MQTLQHSWIKKVFLITAVLTANISICVAQTGAAPDFSGLWMPRGFGRTTPNPLPYNKQAQQLHDEYVKNFTPDDDPGRFCIKPGLPRAIWGAPFPVEIHQTDREITIFYEGYFMYRKIYLEGYKHPDPILKTRMGYSTGHWEGNVLVVKTTYLREYPYMIRTPNSSSATTSERMYLETHEENGGQVKYLVDEMTLNDPVLYTEPVHIKGQIAWSPDTPIMEYSCSETIWDHYLEDHGLKPPDFDSINTAD